MDKEKETGEKKETKVLSAEELEKRAAPFANPLDPSGDGLTGRLKPGDR